MSIINQIDDSTEFLIGLLFTNRQEEVFEEILSSNQEYIQVETDASQCLEDLWQFSTEEKYHKILMNLDSFQADEQRIRELIVYKQGILDGVRICRMLIGM